MSGGTENPDPYDPSFDPTQRGEPESPDPDADVDDAERVESVTLSVGELADVKRRSVLKGLGIGAIVGGLGVGAAAGASELGAMYASVTARREPPEEVPPLDYEWNQYGFEGARWLETSDLQLVFEPGFDMDGWGIKHAADGDADRHILIGAAPDTAFSMDLPFFDAIQALGVTYGFASFQLIAYLGDFGEGFTIPHAMIGRIPIQVPADLMPDGTLKAGASQDTMTPIPKETPGES